MGRQSNFLVQIDDEVKTGGNLEQYLNQKKLQAYSTTIYDYNMASNRSNREGFSAVSFV